MEAGYLITIVLLSAGVGCVGFALGYLSALKESKP